MKKPKTKELSLKERLAQQFLEAYAADFAANGVSVIEQLRQKPEKYAEIGAKLIMSAEPKPDGFEHAETMEELGAKLLKSVGFEQEPTPDMIQAAIDAQDAFVAQLSRIAGGN